MNATLEDILKQMLSTEGLWALSYFPFLVLVLETLVLMWIGKKAYDFLVDYDLETELVKSDNKAVTVGFVGYLAGVAIILEGVLEGDIYDFVPALIEVALWGVIGILLLNLAGKINDHLLLRGIDNKKELFEKHNLAVGVSVAGSYLGSALIVRNIITGESLGWALDLSLTLFYYLVGQLAFFLFGLLYNKITEYDYLQEIKEGNPAAGVSFGMHLTALGLLVSIPIQVSFSLTLLGAWLLVGSTALALFRYIMDRIIIPSEQLDSEIHQDRNWGVALLEGSFAISAVVLLQVIFI